MKWLFTKNNKANRLKDVPELPPERLREQLLAECGNDKRVVGFFGVKNNGGVWLYAILADDENSRLMIASARFRKGASYPSLTEENPSFHLFEREFYEDTGITPAGHPWLKPVRNGGYPFFSVGGEEVHSVGVGPIHAGVIEPGHFRFECSGEIVRHLEIQLGYQHRGIEKMFAGPGYRMSQNGEIPRSTGSFSARPIAGGTSAWMCDSGTHLAGSIAGDSVVAHTTAYANIVESLTGIEVKESTESLRGIGLELERAANHIGDLSALSNDVAYLTGTSFFGALRTVVINATLAVCGSRFGKCLVRPGGSPAGIDAALNKKLRENMKKVSAQLELYCRDLFGTASVLSRFEKTGTVDGKTAKEIGMVGPAARASGLAVDVRSDHPGGIYRAFPVHKVTMGGGDVFARAYIRYVEIKQSVQFINEQLGNFPEHEPEPPAKRGRMAGDSLAVSLVEGWRGETAHFALTDRKGGIVRYKIKDPSFNNWFALALAVRGHGISDFPLCNKSFNLSYCGFDL